MGRCRNGLRLPPLPIPCLWWPHYGYRKRLMICPQLTVTPTTIATMNATVNRARAPNLAIQSNTASGAFGTERHAEDTSCPSSVYPIGVSGPGADTHSLETGTFFNNVVMCASCLCLQLRFLYYNEIIFSQILFY